MYALIFSLYTLLLLCSRLALHYIPNRGSRGTLQQFSDLIFFLLITIKTCLQIYFNETEAVFIGKTSSENIE
jgi:hypothetical protein